MQCGGRDHLNEGLAQQLDLIFGHIELTKHDLIPELELIERLIDDPLLPQENPPAFQVPDTFDLIQKSSHFLLIHINKVNDLIVLLSESLQSLADVCLHFVEQIVVMTEGLDHTLDFLL